jgi:hypothetical protein
MAHDRKQHFIQDPLALRVANLAMVKAMGFKSAIFSIRPNEDSCRDIFRVSTADPHDRHTTFTGRSCDRRYSIFFIHKKAGSYYQLRGFRQCHTRGLPGMRTLIISPTSRIRSAKKSFGECKLWKYHGMDDRKRPNSGVVQQTPPFSKLKQSA